MHKLTFIIILFISSSLYSQVEIDWLKLRDVYYKSEYAEDVYGYVQIPYFGEAVEPLDNKEVVITVICLLYHLTKVCLFFLRTLMLIVFSVVLEGLNQL